MIINYSGTSDDKGLSYSSFNEDSTFIGCVTQLLDDNHTFKFTWADMAGTGKIVNVNEPILIGTLKFTFDSKMDDGDDVYFGVDVSEDEFEEFVTFFKDDNDNSSKLSSEAVLDYQARNCTHPGKDTDEWTVTKEATYSEEGIKTYTCKNCGATKTEVIPKLVRVEKNEQISTVFESLQEEQDEDEINDKLVEETVNSNKVKTGDESGHVILMLLSMSVLSGMVTMLIRAFLRETERT